MRAQPSRRNRQGAPSGTSVRLPASSRAYQRAIGQYAPTVGSISIVFSADQAAAALWTYAEDELVERALALPIEELQHLWALAGSHWREDHTLPLTSRLVPDKVTAFACIEYLEGAVRPLRQERRRPAKAMPERLRNARPMPPGTDVPTQP